METRPGDKVFIYEALNHPEYQNTEGIVHHIDEMGRIFGSWGSAPILYTDEFFIVDNN